MSHPLEMPRNGLAVESAENLRRLAVRKNELRRVALVRIHLGHVGPKVRLAASGTECAPFAPVSPSAPGAASLRREPPLISAQHLAGQGAGIHPAVADAREGEHSMLNDLLTIPAVRTAPVLRDIWIFRRRLRSRRLIGGASVLGGEQQVCGGHLGHQATDFSRSLERIILHFYRQHDFALAAANAPRNRLRARSGLRLGDDKRQGESIVSFAADGLDRRGADAALGTTSPTSAPVLVLRPNSPARAGVTFWIMTPR